MTEISKLWGKDKRENLTLLITIKKYYMENCDQILEYFSFQRKK
jgi:hypothetical protein